EDTTSTADTTGTFTSIDGPLSLTIKENLSSMRSLAMSAVTQRTYNCTNATVKFTGPTTAGQTITVSFVNIFQPHDCIGGHAAAQSVIDMGSLANGTYSLIL